jgi:hypothetical protein
MEPKYNDCRACARSGCGACDDFPRCQQARVSVVKEALDALVSYADGRRMQADSEFSCSDVEDRASEKEFKALVAKLESREEGK